MAEGEPIRGLIPVDKRVLQATMAAAAAQEEMVKVAFPGLQHRADGMTDAATRLTRAGLAADTGAAAVREEMRETGRAKEL